MGRFISDNHCEEDSKGFSLTIISDVLLLLFQRYFLSLVIHTSGSELMDAFAMCFDCLQHYDRNVEFSRFSL